MLHAYTYACLGFFLQKVESWLWHLEETVHKMLRLCFMEVIVAYEGKHREQWSFDSPAQVALTGSQIWWVSDVEMAFDGLEEGLVSALKDCHKKQVWIFSFCLIQLK